MKDADVRDVVTKLVGVPVHRAVRGATDPLCRLSCRMVLMDEVGIAILEGMAIPTRVSVQRLR